MMAIGRLHLLRSTLWHHTTARFCVSTRRTIRKLWERRRELKCSKDGLTYTFKIRKGVNSHDGSDVTSKDVKASYDKIIFPPEGVASARKASYVVVDKIETPDISTVTFYLKHPSASFLANLASPWNFIYKADILAKDPRWYEKNIMGSGPFIFVEYVAGSHWVAKKNPSYFMKGRPYLDGYKAIFIRDTAPRVAAVRSGQALIEFRGFSPASRDDIVRALGNNVVVQESPWNCGLTVTINNEKKPFDDPRVRRALTLAIDRQEASKALFEHLAHEICRRHISGQGPSLLPRRRSLASWRVLARVSRRLGKRLDGFSKKPEFRRVMLSRLRIVTSKRKISR